MIASAKNTGSQLHTDPNLMGAWNLLLTGRKWWVIIPAQLDAAPFSCDTRCSPSYAQDSNAWTWFNHILPQLKDKRLERDISPLRCQSWRATFFRFYGQTMFQVVQEPGDVLYLPHGFPHTVHNVDDNIALTNNYLFPDAIRPLVKALRLKIIAESAGLAGWSEETALHNLYMTSSRAEREQIRDTVERIASLEENYKDS